MNILKKQVESFILNNIYASAHLGDDWQITEIEYSDDFIDDLIEMIQKALEKK
jgi:hypothetical protein